jgi:crossover junction endodeoxyribonuclease RuvC
MSAIICGIDPGVTGGIAFLEDGRVRTGDLPVADGALDAKAVAALIYSHRPDHIYIERAQSYPGQGVASTFKFGQAYGTLLGVIGSLSINTSIIEAATWKRAVGLRSAPKDLTNAKKTVWRKHEALGMATRLFMDDAGQWPLQKNNHRAEAALIAWWGSKQYELHRMQRE